MNVAAAGARLQAAFHAVEADGPRSGFSFRAAAAALLDLNVAAARAGHHVTCDVLRADVAAAGIAIENAFDGVDLQIARTGADARVTSDALDGDIAGAGFGGYGQLQPGDLLIAGAGVGIEVRLRRHGDLIIDRDVAGELAVINFADGNGLAILDDRRVLFNFVDAFFHVAATEDPGTVVRMQLGGDINRAVAALVNHDVPRSGADFKLDRAVHLQRSLKMAGGCRVQRKSGERARHDQNAQSSQGFHHWPPKLVYCRIPCWPSFRPESSSVFEPLEIPTVTASFLRPSLALGSGISIEALRSLS